FKYIGSSPVNPIKFTIVVIGFYVFISLIAGLLIFLVTMAVFWKDVFPTSGFKYGILGGIFTIKGAASFYLSTFIHLFFTITVGLLIATFSKTPQQSLTIGLIILIPSMFLSGMILSVDIIAQSDVLNWISRLIPFRYSTGNMIIASTPLPQLGDMFQQLDNDQMKLIFKHWDVHGHFASFDNGANPRMIARNMDELGHIRKVLGLNINNSLKDKVLFDLTFGAVLDSGVTKSDQNVFNWIDGWAVRRIPDVGAVKGFIIKYFNQFSNQGPHAGSFEGLKPLANRILKGEFGWLDIFLKQTNTLYYQADRVLNFAVPVVISGLSIWYISANFNWSAR
ncbi:MAG: ABC transporter permease, partial [Mycoplasmataceae bacterium]|nr:ABC transporter permease [Mycoplasmataceae bacterium]